MSDNEPDQRALLSCRGVSKSFGAVQALYKVDFDVRAGEVMALVGDNADELAKTPVDTVRNQRLGAFLDALDVSL